MKSDDSKNVRWLLVVLFPAIIFLSGSGSAQMFTQVPKVPAFLPTIDEIPATAPMPIDGVWLIPANGKELRIQAGRAYAMQEWLHAFVFRVRAGMVTMDKIVPTAPGEYRGDELLLIGDATLKVKADRNLAVSVNMPVGTADFNLVPIKLDNPSWYDQEMRTAGLEPPEPQPREIPDAEYQPSAPPPQ